MTKKTTTATDVFDGEYVRIIDKSHLNYGFFGEAAYDPGTGLYDVIEEENGRVLQTVENLLVTQLKAV